MNIIDRLEMEQIKKDIPVFKPGDTLIVYGRESVLSELDKRRRGMSGELSHVDRVAEQEERHREEQSVHARADEPPTDADD